MAEEEYLNAEEQKISRINSAGLTNITLENLWKDCYDAMAKGDLVKWNRKLDAIWIILGGDCSEGGEEDKKYKLLEVSIHKTGSLNHKKTGFLSTQENEAVLMAAQYLYLKEKSLFLKRLQNSQGKGTAYQNEDEDDFD